MLFLDSSSPVKKRSIIRSQSQTIRRSTNAHLRRARSKTLRMTATVVVLYLVCWTPYFVSVALYFADMDFSTGKIRGEIPINEVLVRILYIFAVLNSSLDPYIYGFFSFDLKTELRKLCSRAPRSPRDTADLSLNTGGIESRNSTPKVSRNHQKLSVRFSEQTLKRARDKKVKRLLTMDSGKSPDLSVDFTL